MYTDFDFSNINSSIIEMYIIPSLMRNEDNEEEVVSEHHERRRGLSAIEDVNLNFTWNVTNFEDDTLDIAMIFDNPLEISSYEIQDELYIYFTEDATSLLYSENSTPTTKNYLETRYLKNRIRR